MLTVDSLDNETVLGRTLSSSYSLSHQPASATVLFTTNHKANHSFQKQEGLNLLISNEKANKLPLIINNTNTLFLLPQVKNVQGAFQQLQANCSQKQSADVKILVRKPQGTHEPCHLCDKDIVGVTCKSNISLVYI